MAGGKVLDRRRAAQAAELANVTYYVVKEV